MKNFSIFLFIIFATSITYAQCDITSYIVDSDGYVNVRSEANSKTEVVAKLNSGTTVYYEHNNNSKWYRISLKKNGTPLGYVHSSRLVLWDWPLRAYIINTKDEHFTNICDSPNGSVILKLPSKESYTLGLSDYKNGCWKIESLELINEEQEEETSIPIPSNTNYWIHTTNINSEFKGDGGIPFNLLDNPTLEANIITSYQPGESYPPSITNILELSPDKLFIKIKLNDGHVGWVPTNIVCYSAFTICG